MKVWVVKSYWPAEGGGEETYIRGIFDSEERAKIEARKEQAWGGKLSYEDDLSDIDIIEVELNKAYDMHGCPIGRSSF